MILENSAYILENLILLKPEGYGVYDMEELYFSVSKSLNISKSEYGKIFDFLAEKKYINVKYNDSKTVCFSVTEKAKEYIERTKTDNLFKGKITKKLYLFCFLGSFFGAVLGVFIAEIIGKL